MTATSPPTSSTPTEASTPAGAQTLRTTSSGVLSPPSNRISASATEPMRKASR